MASSFKNILIIRFSSLGDLVLLSALINETKRLYPKAKIDLLTKKKFAYLYQNSPKINRVLAVETDKNINFKSYDLVLDAHGSLRSIAIGLKNLPEFFKKKWLVINKESIKRSLIVLTKNRSIAITPRKKAYLQMLYRINKGTNLQAKTSISLDNKEKLYKKYKKIFTKNTIAVAAGASSKLKKWPYFSKIISELNEKFNIVCVGDKYDFPLKQPLAGVYNLCGKLNANESAAIIKKCNFIIANDSAAVHIAEAVGIKAFVIFGATVPEFGFAPFLQASKVIQANDVKCRPCTKNGKGECVIKEKYLCLKSIGEQQVLATISKSR